MKANCILLVLAITILTCTSCIGQTRKNAIRTVTHNASQYLYLADVASYYGLRCSANGKKVQLSSKYSAIQLTVDSRIMMLNNVQVFLSRPVLLHNNIYVIGKSDFQLILEPVLRPASIPRHNIKTVLIDPGHGGKDVGAIAGNAQEKNINLQVAKRLAYKLKAKGFDVRMTRDKDSEIQLEQRTKYADACKADIFISLHCNSASPSASGLETFIATPAGDPPSNSNIVSKNSCPANAFAKESAYLAYYVQRAILKQTGMHDRGLKRMRFHVVRNTNCPSILVEMGFMSNPDELKVMQTPVRQEQIADAIAETVVKMKATVK